MKDPINQIITGINILMKNTKEGFFYKKLFHLLDSNHKKELVFLAILLIIGIFFEMLGLGILLPAITVLLDSDVGTTYPQLKLPHHYALLNLPKPLGWVPGPETRRRQVH